jgi:hypothetical protein
MPSKREMLTSSRGEQNYNGNREDYNLRIETSIGDTQQSNGGKLTSIWGKRHYNGGRGNYNRSIETSIGDAQQSNGAKLTSTGASSWHYRISSRLRGGFQRFVENADVAIPLLQSAIMETMVHYT